MCFGSNEKLFTYLAKILSEEESAPNIEQKDKCKLTIQEDENLLFVFYITIVDPVEFKIKLQSMEKQCRCEYCKSTMMATTKRIQNLELQLTEKIRYFD